MTRFKSWLPNARLKLWALTAGILITVSAPALAAPTITATPQVVTIPAGQKSGKTVITWNAGADNPDAEVWLAVGNVVDEPFDDRSNGRQQVVIETGKTYTFNLYKDDDAQQALATVVVTTKMAGEANDGEADDNAAPDDAPEINFSGTWPTIAGGTHEYSVILKQVGNKVTGTFSPGNGKIFDGLVQDNQLTFNWTQNGGYEGTGEFTLNADGKSFKGSSTALKPQQFTNTWNSFIPEPLALAGVWETNSNNAQFALTLQQEGDKVTGTYSPSNGKIEGTIKDRILRFTWSSDNGEGSGRFVFDKSEMAFSGSYSNSDDPEQADGLWNGTRKVGGGGGKNVGASGGKTAPVSFAGTWNAVSDAGVVWVFIIQQNKTSGSVAKATGSFFRVDDSATRFTIKDAYVTDKTLRFDTTLNGKYTNKNGKFVMDEGGKSFKGAYANSPMTGTFVK